MWKILGVVAVLALATCVCGGAAGAAYWLRAGDGQVTGPGSATTPGGEGNGETTAPGAEGEADKPNPFPGGMAAYEAGRYEEALSAFDDAVRANPQDPIPMSWRGRTYARLERLDRAETDLDDASKRLPNDLETWRSLGWVRDRKGDDQEALLAWDHAIGLAPADAKLKLSRANTNFKLGKRLAAVDDATAACDLGLEEGCTLRARLHGSF